MKRFLLIAAGTVGGLGAVLSVTPPQLGATDLGLGLDMGTLTTAETPAQTPTVVQNTPATSAPTQSTTKPSIKLIQLLRLKLRHQYQHKLRPQHQLLIL